MKEPSDELLKTAQTVEFSVNGPKLFLKSADKSLGISGARDSLNMAVIKCNMSDSQMQWWGSQCGCCTCPDRDPFTNISHAACNNLPTQHTMATEYFRTRRSQPSERLDGCSVKVTSSSSEYRDLLVRYCSIMELFPAKIYCHSVQSEGPDWLPPRVVLFAPTESLSDKPADLDLTDGEYWLDHRRRLYSGDITFGFAKSSTVSEETRWKDLVSAASDILYQILHGRGAVADASDRLTLLDPSNLTCKMSTDQDAVVPVDPDEFVRAMRNNITRRGKPDPGNIPIRPLEDLSAEERSTLATVTQS